MAESISIDMLAGEIAKAMSNYEQNIIKGIDVSSEKIAKKAVKTLKETSPKDTGDYAKGWTYDKPDYYSPSTKVRTVYNKTDYQLTHLLENGHMNRNGSRTEGKPHIAPAEKQAVEEFEKEVKEVIENADAGA